MIRLHNRLILYIYLFILQMRNFSRLKVKSSLILTYIVLSGKNITNEIIDLVQHFLIKGCFICCLRASIYESLVAKLFFNSKCLSETFFGKTWFSQLLHNILVFVINKNMNNLLLEFSSLLYYLQLVFVKDQKFLNTFCWHHIS